MGDSKNNSSSIAKFIAGSALAAGGFFAAKKLVSSFNKFRLSGKVVLITGGSRGLGLVLARHFADEGAKVAICARSVDELQRASEDLAGRTTHFLAVPCDVTDQQQVQNMIEQISKEMGNIDVLINNASIIQMGPMESMTYEDYEAAMKTHFWGPFYTMNEVLPDMIGMGGGRIVNIVSIGGKLSFPHLLPYTTSKYALSGLSEGMAAELKKYNINITTVYPGFMRTGSPMNIDVKGQYQKEYAWFKISDSLPVLSMDVDKAAQKIIEAMKKGKKTITLTIPAKIAIAAHGISPGFIISFFDLINNLLPEMKGGHKAKKGYESASKYSSTFLSKKTDEAENYTLQKNNSDSI
ncbi:MAG TPA: SDR family oxidoreductase [Balneolaceae bacterium]|nr:SDR family oxidoreductase [Balneolaceae bacterium]